MRELMYTYTTYKLKTDILPNMHFISVNEAHFAQFAGLLLTSIISHLSNAINATGIDNMGCEIGISLFFAATPNKKILSKSHYLSMDTFVLRFDNINGNKAMGMDKTCVDLWKPAPVQRKRCNITRNYYGSSFPMTIIITTPSFR